MKPVKHPHRITFGKLTVENFKSIGSEVEFDFSRHFGLNYIFGTNKDIEGTSNGSGKCVDGSTEIEIKFDCKDDEKLFRNFINKYSGDK